MNIREHYSFPNEHYRSPSYTKFRNANDLNNRQNTHGSKEELPKEKPTHPKNEYAVPGIYFFDSRAPGFVKHHNPSPRGELEITTLIGDYLKEGTLQVEKLGCGTAWLDTSTHDSLLDAAVFVRVLEKCQGLKMACLEEIALDHGCIYSDQREKQIKTPGKSN